MEAMHSAVASGLSFHSQGCSMFGVPSAEVHKVYGWHKSVFNLIALVESKLQHMPSTAVTACAVFKATLRTLLESCVLCRRTTEEEGTEPSEAQAGDEKKKNRVVLQSVADRLQPAIWKWSSEAATFWAQRR